MTDVSQLLETRRSRIGRWIAAALVVCALHAGGVVLAVMYPPDENAWDDPAGGVNVDLVAPPAPTPVKSEDVAHGPEQPYGREAAEATKQVVQKVEKDLPLVEPSPAPDPEVVLPKLRPDEKEQPKEEARDATEKQVAQEEGEEVKTAPPRVEAQPAPSAVAKPGQSLVVARVQATWQKSLSKHLERYKRFPELARRQGLKGSVGLRFVLDRSGQVILAEITKSSGSPVLDEEVLAMLKRASPVPVPPGEVTDAYLENNVRIDFK